MRIALATLIALLSVLAWSSQASASDNSASSRDSLASLYPAHTQVSIEPWVENGALTCSWSFQCSTDGNLPMYHTKTEDALGRTDGWAVSGVLDDDLGNPTVIFLVYVNHYATPDQAQTAVSDMNKAAHALGYHPRPAPDVLGTAQGTAYSRGKTVNGASGYLIGACTGTTEVEAQTIWLAGTPNYVKFRQDLRSQVAWALQQTASP